MAQTYGFIARMPAASKTQYNQFESRGDITYPVQSMLTTLKDVQKKMGISKKDLRLLRKSYGNGKSDLKEYEQRMGAIIAKTAAHQHIDITPEQIEVAKTDAVNYCHLEIGQANYYAKRQTRNYIYRGIGLAIGAIVGYFGTQQASEFVGKIMTLIAMAEGYVIGGGFGLGGANKRWSQTRLAAAAFGIDAAMKDAAEKKPDAAGEAKPAA